MKRELLIIMAFLAVSISINAQNTFGTTLITEDVYEAFTLVSLHKKSYMINNCGEVINEWNSDFLPGNAVYFLEDGSLLRAGRTNSTTISFGGRGGVIEKFNWEGDLIWQFFYDTPQFRQHHDIFPMPNGNVLILAATVMTNAQAIQAGRNPSLLSEGILYNEQIIEVAPVGFNQGNIVWEWNAKDHFIQDFDSSKDNFGNIALNPNKIDINFLNGFPGIANWLHLNSIQYDAVYDQIIISSRQLSEFWIIDHSTTTAEASTSAGGTYGKGGDLLYRWGNPQAYQQGTEDERVLYGQHTPHRVPAGLNHAGKLLLFNNGNGRFPLFSEVMVIDTPFDSPGFYTQPSNAAFGPIAADYTYVDIDDITNFYSPILSNAQILPNGNTLICSGARGVIFEINPQEEIVWKYVTPVNNETGDIATQGQTTMSFQNLTFRAIKFAPNYAGFAGKDLTPGNPIELNPDLSPCNSLSLDEIAQLEVKMFPNPVAHLINIRTNNIINHYTIYNVLGHEVKKADFQSNIDVASLSAGVYFLRLTADSRNITLKFIKI